MLRVLWPLLLVLAVIVLVAALRIDADAEWTVSCQPPPGWGAGIHGMDCLTMGQDVHWTTKSTPARWIAYDGLGAAEGLSLLLIVVAMFGCWLSWRPRFARGYRADLRRDLTRRP